VPDLLIDPNWTPMFERYVVRSGSKVGYQKDMSLREIELSGGALY
jgi:hypothetical protein